MVLVYDRQQASFHGFRVNAPTPVKQESASGLSSAWRLSVVVVAVFLALFTVQGDDGLRHIGLAFGTPRPWGAVYPFSYFQVYSGYDLWRGYDLSLRALARVLGLLPVPLAVQRMMALKLVSGALAGMLLWLCVRRARIAEALRTPASLLLGLAMTAAWLAEPVLRQLMARPFAFGTLLLVFAVGQRGAVRGFLACALTIFLYPHLAWLYTGAVGVAHLVRGDRRFAAGSLLATALSFVLQPPAFWGMFGALLHADRVRAQLPNIGELTSLWDNGAQLVMSLGVLIVLLPQVREPRRLGVEQVLMLAFVPAAIKYVRYFVDVELTLAFVAYGADALRALERAAARLLGDWRRLLGSHEVPASPAPGRSRLLRPLLVLGYAAVAVLLALDCVRQYHQLGRAGALLAGVPAGTLILTGFNDQYDILYNRPDLSVVPSCEIGLVRDDIESAYVDFFKRGRVCHLAKTISASYLLDSRGNYLDPTDTACLHLVRDDGLLRLWEIARKDRPR